NPQDIQRVDSIHQVMRGHKVQLAVGLKKDIQQFLAAVGGEGASGAGASMSDILSHPGNETAAEKEMDAGGSEVDENDSAVIRLANQVIVDAFKARASDIHIEPYGSQKDTMIRLRVDGACNEYQRVPGAFRRALVARVKIMAMLDIAERRKKPERKIWTAEDPVEITQYGLRQVQVQPKIGFTFAQAMRAFLRADPDVIMVGEMRDEETAETGIEASLTGHLVLSTLHTNSAVE